jgi:hypothetical protein
MQENYKDARTIMKVKVTRIVATASNLSIVLLALTATTVLVKNYLLRSPAGNDTATSLAAKAANASQNVSQSGADRPRGPIAGTNVALPGFDWSGSNKTVVLALSSKCHFCSESAPFYQRLTNELSQKSDVRLVAIFPQDGGEAKEYLIGLGVRIGEIRQASLNSIEVSGTPTLMIVDSHGTVKQSWVGKLSTEKESEVLVRVSLRESRHRSRRQNEKNLGAFGPGDIGRLVGARLRGPS